MTGFQGMVGFDISYGFIRRAGMVENHPWYNVSPWLDFRAWLDLIFLMVSYVERAWLKITHDIIKGLILCWRSLLPHTSGWERWSQSFTEMRSIEVKDAVIIARGLMCEATMTNNTGFNFISWAVDLNDRKSPFQSEYSCRSEQW